MNIAWEKGSADAFADVPSFIFYEKITGRIIVLIQNRRDCIYSWRITYIRVKIERSLGVNRVVSVNR